MEVGVVLRLLLDKMLIVSSMSDMADSYSLGAKKKVAAYAEFFNFNKEL